MTNATVLYAGAADPDIAVLLGLSTTTDSSAPSEADSSTADTEAGADTESDASGGADSSQSSGGDSSSSSSILIIAVSVTAGVLVAVTAGEWARIPVRLSVVVKACRHGHLAAVLGWAACMACGL